MRKIIIPLIVVVALFASCKKEKQETKSETENIIFRAEAISIDGHIDYSKSVLVTF